MISGMFLRAWRGEGGKGGGIDLLNKNNLDRIWEKLKT